MPHKKPMTSIAILKDELSRLGYSHTMFAAKNGDYVLFESPNGATWLTKASDIDYPMVNASADFIINHKNITYDLAKQWGISVPVTLEIQRGMIDQVRLSDMLSRYKKVIVKPLKASLSRGLALDIDAVEALIEAIDKAHEYSETALVQQQVWGEEVRFTVLDGEVVSALLRRTPRVVGDGVSSVASLITQENLSRKSIVTSYESYPELTADIIDGGYLSDGRVLESGDILELSKAVMVKDGASMHEIIEDVDPTYINVVEGFATKLSAGFLTIDLMIQDYTQKLTRDNYALIECNTGPILRSYYSCRDGKQVDILQKLIPLLDSAICH